jgi:hypothetical protein
MTEEKLKDLVTKHLEIEEQVIRSGYEEYLAENDGALPPLGELTIWLEDAADDSTDEIHDEFIYLLHKRLADLFAQY